MNLSKEYIAYKVKDIEGDSWCEVVFFFKNREDVRSFFHLENQTFINQFTDEDNRDILDFEIHDDNPAKHISAITFETESHGEVVIHEMSGGYIVNIIK